jgi:hypothetical protein
MNAGTNNGVLPEWGRTTPFGMLRYAEDYRVAAELVAADAKDELKSPPAWTLIGQSLKLSLKAFLRSHQWEMHRIEKLRHNLVRCLEEARTQGIANVVPLAAADLQAIELFNVTYSAHRHRYLETGTMFLTDWKSLAQLAQKLTSALHDRCLEMSIGAADATQMKQNRGGWAFRRGDPKAFTPSAAG